jgi:hypothetical protein
MVLARELLFSNLFLRTNLRLLNRTSLYPTPKRPTTETRAECANGKARSDPFLAERTQLAALSVRWPGQSRDRPLKISGKFRDVT